MVLDCHLHWLARARKERDRVRGAETERTSPFLTRDMTTVKADFLLGDVGHAEPHTPVCRSIVRGILFLGYRRKFCLACFGASKASARPVRILTTLGGGFVLPASPSVFPHGVVHSESGSSISPRDVHPPSFAPSTDTRE